MMDRHRNDNDMDRDVVKVSRGTSSENWERMTSGGESVLYPDAEELRMVRAIALRAVLEAAHRGEYRARFRGCSVHAWRRPAEADAAQVLEVRLAIALGATSDERYRVVLAADLLDERPRKESSGSDANPGT